jgi:hypothetical protein
MLNEEIKLNLSHIFPVVNYSNPRRVPFPISLTFPFSSNSENIYILQKTPINNQWINSTELCEVKIIQKSDEIKEGCKYRGDDLRQPFLGIFTSCT